MRLRQPCKDIRGSRPLHFSDCTIRRSGRRERVKQTSPTTRAGAQRFQFALCLVLMGRGHRSRLALSIAPAGRAPSSELAIYWASPRPSAAELTLLYVAVLFARCESVNAEVAAALAAAITRPLTRPLLIDFGACADLSELVEVLIARGWLETTPRSGHGPGDPTIGLTPAGRAHVSAAPPDLEARLGLAES